SPGRLRCTNVLRPPPACARSDTRSPLAAAPSRRRSGCRSEAAPSRTRAAGYGCRAPRPELCPTLENLRRIGTFGGGCMCLRYRVLQLLRPARRGVFSERALAGGAGDDVQLTVGT